MSRSSLLDGPATGSHGDVSSKSRLVVTQRNPVTSSYRAIGFLDKTASGFEFAYLAAAVSAPGFTPLVGFRDTHKRYVRARLFSAFSERIISAKRPDRPQYLASLDLTEAAGPWEILSKSGGHRQGDAIELLQMPEFDPMTRHTSSTFLAHGVRHRSEKAQARVTDLAPGERLRLVPEPGNKVNPRALQVVSDDGEHLGFVPDPLVEYTQSLLAHDPRLSVVRANGPEVGPHMRLLVRLEGTYDGDAPFTGPDWRATA